MHQQGSPLLLGNVWSVQSAKVFEKSGYDAIATSSAVAEMLGYADGEEIPLDEYLFIIVRIAKSTDLPLSVDLEAGYGETVEEVSTNIKRLSGLGVVGINLEDSMVENGKRKLREAEPFRDRLLAFCNALQKESIQMFINVRNDVFLMGHEHPLAEAKKRIKLYENTGVHGLFFPCVYNILGSVEDARDTVQDVMVRYPDISAQKLENEMDYLVRSVVNKSRDRKVSDEVWLSEPIATDRADTDLHNKQILS